MKKLLCILSLFLFIPNFAFTCTPVMVGMIFLGPTLFGSIALSSTLGILLAVAIKIVVFLIISDYKSAHIVWMMLLANALSTLIGFGIYISAAVPTLMLFTLPVAFVCFLRVAKNFHRHNIMMKRKPTGIAGLLTGLLFVTIILYGIGQGALDFSSNLVVYWILKILSSILAIGLTLLFSVVIEEAVIAGLYKKIHGEDKNFLKPVLWANIIAFIIVFGAAAVKSLPVRLRTPGFLYPKW